MLSQGSGRLRGHSSVTAQGVGTDTILLSTSGSFELGCDPAVIAEARARRSFRAAFPPSYLPDQSDRCSLPALPIPQSRSSCCLLQEISALKDAHKAEEALPRAACAHCLVLQHRCLLRCSWGSGWLAASKKHPLCESWGKVRSFSPTPAPASQVKASVPLR